MSSIQPELWVDAPREAVSFYQAAFGATVLHLVGDGDDIAAQLAVGDAAFWVAPSSTAMKRLSPRAIDGRIVICASGTLSLGALDTTPAHW